MNTYTKMICAVILSTAIYTLHAQEVRVHLDEAGTLNTKIESTKYDQIKKLTISGYINGFDLYCIAKMDNLNILNLKDATILGGGSFGTSTYTENNTIKKNNFSHCDMRTLILPNTLLYIHEHAFDNVFNIEYIEIGDNLVEISDKAFVNPQNSYEHSIRTNEKLKAFTVSDKNEHFTATDGVLFDKNMTTLLFYPNMKSKEYTIPEGVTNIRSRAFSVCTNLLEISLPKSLKEVGQSAFENCEHLLKITSHSIIPPEAEKKNNGTIFYNVPTNSCILYVPIGTYSDYWMAPAWGSFNNIKEYEPTSILSTQENHINIQNINGGILIETPNPQTIISIHTTDGALIYKGKEHYIPLNSGLYIIKVENTVVKALVK